MPILRSLTVVFFQALFLTLLCVGVLGVGYAEVRSSASYQLQSDSVNFGGGLSESASYSLESTAGEVATGDGVSPTYQLRAGYQQMQEVFLSITDAANVTMSPSIGGLTGGVANGSTSVVVLTDSPAGYELTIAADNSPAMQGALDTIADYVPTANPLPDYAFTTGATNAYFGFSPEGVDIVTRYRNSGAVCGSGSADDASACWDGLSVVDTLIARGSANQPSGATTTIRFRVEVGGDAPVIAGTYIATTTLTAVPL